MPVGTEVDRGPGHIVLDGDPAPSKGAQQPLSFRPISVAAKWSLISAAAEHLLWPPCIADAVIIFFSCGFFLLSFVLLFLFLALISGRRLDVYRTSTHGVALVPI